MPAVPVCGRTTSHPLFLRATPGYLFFHRGGRRMKAGRAIRRYPISLSISSRLEHRAMATSYVTTPRL